MKDALGQKIQPGSKAIWCGGKTQYSGAHPWEISRLTSKKVVLLVKDVAEIHYTEKFIDPMDIVVVDKLLNNDN